MNETFEITSEKASADLSFWDKVGNWSEWASDYGNAILVKEGRQALKSKQFVITFLLMLIACWVISMFGVMLYGNSIQYGETANGFFVYYYIVLTTAVLVIVPFIAFRSLIQERDLSTFDMLSITSLKPRQIIVGKLLSAMLQTLIYFSAITPFIAFTSFLGGFDFFLTVLALFVALILSTSYCTIALMIAAFAKNRVVQSLLTVGVLFGLGFLQIGFISFVFAMQYENVGEVLVHWEFWTGVGICALVVISYIVLFSQVATTQLTFASGNRSTAIRITCFIQFLLFWSIFIGTATYGAWASGTAGSSFFFPADIIVFITCVTGIHIALVGLFTTTESNFLSRRIRRDLPKLSIVRLVSIPLMPGGTRGLIYSLIQIVIMGLLAEGIWLVYGSDYSRTVKPHLFDQASIFVLLTCCYLIIFLNCTTFFIRMGEKLSGDIRPGHVRALSFVLLAGVSIAPLFVRFFYSVILNERPDNFMLIDGISPFWTLAYSMDSADADINTLAVLIPLIALVTLFFNLPHMITSIREILFSRFTSNSKNDHEFN